MRSILFVVPARGGSKGFPGKNLKTLGGITLVGRAVRRAVQAARQLGGRGHRVVCSTDDESIAEAARLWGAETPFARPAHLATDEALAVDVALHAVDWFAERQETFGVVALVQATSPLATPSDLAAALRLFETSPFAPVVSVSATHPLAWTYELVGGRLHTASPGLPAAPVNRRQESPVYVRPNGAIFIADPEVLRRTRSFLRDGETRASVMSLESSVDVDCESDLIMCEGLLSQRGVPPVPLSDRLVGDGQPCLVIAEAGVNHNGDEEKAHALVDAAADAGADVVKFQTFVPEALATRDAPLAPYQRAALPAFGTQLDMLRRLCLPGATHRALRDHAAARGLLFLSSPFDEASADMLERLGVPAFKIPSGELTNLSFLAHVARKGRPLLLSTGMSSLPEVAAAVDAIAAAGDPPLVLLHCVSGYPTPAREANLRAMTTLRAAFGRPVGWSDHTQGEAAAIAAVALGAAVVEKHLTLDRDLPGPDHSASTEPAEFRRLVHALREAEAALGSGIKAPVAAEAATLSAARRSLYWRSGLDAGTVLSADHVVALRPAGGLAPAVLPGLIGRRLRRRVAADRPVELDDLEPHG